MQRSPFSLLSAVAEFFEVKNEIDWPAIAVEFHPQNFFKLTGPADNL